MARIIGGIAASHTPTIGFAFDRDKQDDPVWAPIFAAFDPVRLEREWREAIAALAASLRGILLDLVRDAGRHAAPQQQEDPDRHERHAEKLPQLAQLFASTDAEAMLHGADRPLSVPYRRLMDQPLADGPSARAAR